MSNDTVSKRILPIVPENKYVGGRDTRNGLEEKRIDETQKIREKVLYNNNQTMCLSVDCY